VDGDRREVALLQKLVELDGTLHRLHKHHNLVKLQSIEQLVEFAVLLVLSKLDVMLQHVEKRRDDIAARMHTLQPLSPALPEKLTCCRPWSVSFESST